MDNNSYRESMLETRRNWENMTFNFRVPFHYRAEAYEEMAKIDEILRLSENGNKKIGVLDKTRVYLRGKRERFFQYLIKIHSKINSIPY